MRNLYRFFAFMLLSAFAAPLAAQWANPLPAGWAPGEKEMMRDYLASRAAATRGITTPPPFPVRTMAEWEEIQALAVSYDKGWENVVRQIVDYAKDECEVIVVCPDSAVAKSEFTNMQGITDFSNITFRQIPANTIWIRDYGQNTVYQNEVDSVILVDWIYNRPRPQDDVVPEDIASYLGVPIYSTTTAPYDLVHTGGNFMSDGMGSGFSSKLVLEENQLGCQFCQTIKTEAEIDSIMYQFMGIDRYIKMETLPYDGIHHIDMHMKLLDEETILMGEYPFGDADGPQIEANLQYVLNNFNSAWGTPYKVVRIEMPPDANGNYPDDGPAWNPGDYRTFTNSVFINKTVLVPVYEEKYDTTALRIYREALPGYRVIGIDCNSIIQAGGAIHCITKAVGVDDPLYIAHQPLPDTQDDQNDYVVNAIMKHREGIANPTLYWTTDTALGWNTDNMLMTGTPADNYAGKIPAQALGTRVYYYVEATGGLSKVQRRPMPAPQGWWTFKIDNFVADENVLAAGTGMDPVFPNPARAITCVPLHAGASFEGKLSVRDLMGRTVEVLHEGRFPAGESKYFLNAATYTRGAYLIVLETGAGQEVRKLIVR